MNKNLLLLTLSQVFGFTAATITVFLSGIIGSKITSIQILSTLPTALYVVGTATFTILAAKIMSKIGRRLGFIFASLIMSATSLLAAFAISQENFILFCISCLILGMEVPTTAAYIICVSVAGPALVDMGLDILLVHLYIIYIQ